MGAVGTMAEIGPRRTGSTAGTWPVVLAIWMWVLLSGRGDFRQVALLQTMIYGLVRMRHAFGRGLHFILVAGSCSRHSRSPRVAARIRPLCEPVDHRQGQDLRSRFLRNGLQSE
jgi:hypothetical protein